MGNHILRLLQHSIVIFLSFVSIFTFVYLEREKKRIFAFSDLGAKSWYYFHVGLYLLYVYIEVPLEFGVCLCVCRPIYICMCYLPRLKHVGLSQVG